MPAAELIYGTYPHGTPLFAGGLRAVNMYAEKAEGQARAPYTLIGAPGMKLFSTPTGTTGLEVRGFTIFQDTLYAVIGSFLFTVSSAGTSTQVASGIAGSGPVSFASDNDQLVIVTTPGTDDYLWDGTSLSQLTGDNIVDWRDVAFIDGRAVFVQNDPSIAGRFSYTDVNQLATIGAASFANAESAADSLLRILKTGRRLWMLGPETAEPWYATGDSDTPFARYSDGIEAYGIGAEKSATVLGNVGFYLSVSRQARPHVRMVTEGGGSERISSNAIDAVIDSGTYSDAIGFAHEQRGHLFYYLVLPTLGRCFGFDASTGFPHERQSGVSEVASWDARQSIVAHDKVIVGHKSDGKLYELDFATHTDASVSRLAMFCADLGMSGEYWNRIDKVLLDISVGEAAAGATVEPKIMMQISRDGGQTWGDERWRGLGFSGDYDRQVKWSGCGRARTALARFKITDSVVREVTKVHASGTPGRPV